MPDTGETHSIEVWTGEEVDVTYQGPAGTGARFDVESEAGRWRVDITRSGEYEKVQSWNADGDLDDLALPDWMDDVVSQLRA